MPLSDKQRAILEMQGHRGALAYIAELEAEVKEQCRLNSMGSEREARLMAERERLREDKARFVERTIDRAYQKVAISRPVTLTTRWWREFRAAAIDTARGDDDGE